MSGGPFNPVKDLVRDAKSTDHLKDIKTKISKDSTSLTLLFGGNPVEGEYSLDALCPPGSSNTDYLDHLVAVSPALHVCRVYLSLANHKEEEVVVLLLNAGQATIGDLRAALADEFNNRRFPVLRTTATSPATSWPSEQLVFLSETGEKLDDDATRPVASDSEMRDFGRHSAVIAQLKIPKAAGNRMGAVLPWDSAEHEAFANSSVYFFALKADGISEVAKGEEEIPERLSRYTLGKDLIAQQLLAGQVPEASEAVDNAQGGVLTPEKILEDIDSNAPVSAREDTTQVQGGTYNAFRISYVGRLIDASRRIPSLATKNRIQMLGMKFARMAKHESNTPESANIRVASLVEGFDSIDEETETSIRDLFSTPAAFIEKLSAMRLTKHDSEAASKKFSELNTTLGFQEKVRCADPSTATMSTSRLDVFVDGCLELQPLFQALVAEFAKAAEFETTRSEEAFAGMSDTFTANVSKAKEVLKSEVARAKEEANNHAELRKIAKESSAFHFLAAEQISWARENVALAQRNSADKLSRLDAELARLHAERDREASASKALEAHAAFLRKEAMDELSVAKRLQDKVLHAARKSTIRVQRANTGVDVTKSAVFHLEELQKEVTNEAAELASYAVELKKAVAVDAADAYLGAMKFNYIEAKNLGTNLVTSTAKLQVAQRHFLEMRRAMDKNIPSTVEDVEEAEKKMKKEVDNDKTIQDKIQELAAQAAAIDSAFGPLKEFLGSHAATSNPNGMTVQAYCLTAVHLKDWPRARAEGPGATREIPNPDLFRSAYTDRFAGRDEGVNESTGVLLRNHTDARLT